jgi:hypothetical protein
MRGFIVLPFFFPAELPLWVAGPEEAKNPAGGVTSARFRSVKRRPVWKKFVNPSTLIAASTDHRFKFQKPSQLFIRTHNETFFVAAMCVGDPDRSPLRING